MGPALYRAIASTLDIAARQAETGRRSSLAGDGALLALSGEGHFGKTVVRQ
jgi:hypothetical protein